MYTACDRRAQAGAGRSFDDQGQADSVIVLAQPGCGRLAASAVGHAVRFSKVSEKQRVESVGALVLDPVAAAADDAELDVRSKLTELSPPRRQERVNRGVALAIDDGAGRPRGLRRNRVRSALSRCSRTASGSIDRSSATIRFARLWRCAASLSPSGSWRHRCITGGGRRAPSPPGPTRVRDRTRSPSMTQRGPPSAPPNEKPTTWRDAVGMGNLSRPSTITAASDSSVTGSGASADSPNPGKSRANAAWRAARASTVRIQCVQEPKPPCRSSSGTPEPHERHTMSPPPHGVVQRRARLSMALRCPTSQGAAALDPARAPCRPWGEPPRSMPPTDRVNARRGVQPPGSGGRRCRRPRLRRCRPS
jgi:hypothetical protein